MLPLMSLEPSMKLSKANSPGVTEKHKYITRQTLSDKVEVEVNLGLEKIEPDLHSKVSGSRRDSYPERPGTRIQHIENERLSVVAASRASVFNTTNESGEITSLPQPRKTSADNVELPGEEPDSPSVWLESRAGT